MRNTVLIITALFLLSVISLKAQEKKKIQVKIIKGESGGTIEIDTSLNSEHGDVYFYSDGNLSQEKMDSILKSLNIESEHGLKFISENLEGIDSENVKHIWIFTTEGEESNMDKHAIIEMVDGEKIIEITDEFEIFDGDSKDIKTEYIIYTGDENVYKKDKDGKKVFVSTSAKSSSYVWNSNDSDSKLKVITITDDIDADAKEHVKVFSTSSDDNVNVSEVIIKKGDDLCKTIEVTFNEDDFDADNKFIKLEEVMEKSGENVKITKYSTHDGKLVIKAELTDCNLSKDEVVKAKSIGLEDKVELKVKKFKAYPNPTDGKFEIEFECDQKESTLIKVYNQEGKTVYSEKIKNFEGVYSNKIDISKEEKGIYFIRIIQGDKTITKKIIKK